jgi:A/G-specific adenine glycosylase
MLQQTRVETAAPYFERFMSKFPTALALAEAPEDEVLAVWSGLGYYRRARQLHAGAKLVAKSGVMPSSRSELLALPGIGPYTAGAIASIAYGHAVGLVDGNVARVLSRVFVIDEDMRQSGMRRAEGLAERLVPPAHAGAWNQALMELGATICTPRLPACERCPIASSCGAYKAGRVHELPVVSKRAKPKAQRVQSLVASRDGRVLLARRRSGGLFGGLWEPPSMDGGPRVAESLLERFPVAPVERHRKVSHVLSHRRLLVDVHVARLSGAPRDARLPDVYEALDLFDEESIARVGIATLARKILAVGAD